MSRTIPERLEESIRLFAAYEEEIWPDQYDDALSAVRDLQATLAEIHLPENFIDCAFISANAPVEAPVDASTLMQRMIDLEFAREKADDARLALAAYQPYGRSKARRHLQERKCLAGDLRRLVEAAANVLQESGRTTSLTVRPDYLQVVPGETDISEEENHD
jgi:hypothetical protein